MVSFGVQREELKDGWLHSTGGMVSDTRMLEVDYLDNRRIVTNLFDSQGTVIMTNFTNPRHLPRRIKYRHTVNVPLGEYTISQHDTDYEVCVDSGKVVFYTDAVLGNGVSHTQEWAYTVEIEPYGDIDGDGYVEGSDLGLLFGDWGTDIEQSDLNSDGIVDSEDLGILLSNWTG